MTSPLLKGRNQGDREAKNKERMKVKREREANENGNWNKSVAETH